MMGKYNLWCLLKFQQNKLKDGSIKMEKFIIKKIEADFDERWLRVKKIDDGKEYGSEKRR